MCSVKFASLNLNKRLGNPAASARFHRWLIAHEIEVVAVQEPVRMVGALKAVTLDGYKLLGGNERVAIWAQEQLDLPSGRQIEDYTYRLDLGYFALLNCYLDAYQQSARATQLTRIRQICADEGDRPLLLVGDFNLAPNPDDGLTNGKPSDFNSSVDRQPFETLLRDCSLIDAGSAEPRDFTISRTLGKSLIQFRCDLLLVSDYCGPDVQFAYDHSVRTEPSRFTDHSAMIITLPVDIPRTHTASGLLFPMFDSASADSPLPGEDDGFHPHKTAMSRQNPSPIAIQLAERIFPSRSTQSVLDYGCGRGIDVAYYRARGMAADGYDPHEPFGWSKLPDREYDAVTVIFVLNVLPTPWARLEVLRRASRFLRAGGIMIVGTRSPKEIASHASLRHWRVHNDGFWSHEQRGTFQKGISRPELIALARRAGLFPVDDAERITTGDNAIVATFVKGAVDTKASTTDGMVPSHIGTKR